MATFPCTNSFSDGRIQDLGYFYLMWPSWSSLLQQQQRGLGLFSTHSQALGTAAQYQRLRHHCAALIHSCCCYWLCCSEISDFMHESVLVTDRIDLFLAHACLIWYLDYYHRMAEIGKELWRWPGLARLPDAGCPGLSPDSFWVPPRMEIPQPRWAPCTRAQSLDKEVSPAHICGWGCSSSGAGPCTSWHFSQPISPAILYCYTGSKLSQNHLFALGSAD